MWPSIAHLLITKHSPVKSYNLTQGAALGITAQWENDVQKNCQGKHMRKPIQIDSWSSVEHKISISRPSVQFKQPDQAPIENHWNMFSLGGFQVGHSNHSYTNNGGFNMERSRVLSKVLDPWTHFSKKKSRTAYILGGSPPPREASHLYNYYIENRKWEFSSVDFLGIDTPTPQK